MFIINEEKFSYSISRYEGKRKSWVDYRAFLTLIGWYCILIIFNVQSVKVKTEHPILFYLQVVADICDRHYMTGHCVYFSNVNEISQVWSRIKSQPLNIDIYLPIQVKSMGSQNFFQWRFLGWQENSE